MERRKVRDREHAVELLDAMEASGLPLSVFCRRRGIDGRSLQCWRRNLTRVQAPRPAAVRFVELTTASARAQASYRVHVGDAVIEVDDDFSEHTLTRLLRAVASC